MQVTDTFKTVIQNHLEAVAQADPLFAETFKKPKKNISDCVTYIINEVKKSGKAGFADEEIFNMAIHYYDEDDIKVGEKVNAKVVVNHKVETPKKEPGATVQTTPSVKKVVTKKPGVKNTSVQQPSFFS